MTKGPVKCRNPHLHFKFTKTEAFHTSTKNLFEHSKMFLNYESIVRCMDSHPALQFDQQKPKLTEKTELEFLIKASGKRIKVHKFFKKRDTFADRLWKTKYRKFKVRKRKPTFNERAANRLLKWSREVKKTRNIKKCRFCRFETWYLVAMARHKLVKHRTKKQRIACTEMDRILAPSVYEGMEKMAMCRKCGKEFAQEDSLKKHIQVVHQKKKPHKCKECGKQFGQRQDLTVHMNTHTGIKPFACEKCDKRFTSSSSRNAHVRQIHEKIRPHVCKICEKSFGQLHQLKSHTRFHTGYKPYKCKHCDYATVTAGLLKIHVRGVHRICDVTNGRIFERFKCIDCGTNFDSKMQLETHSNIAKGVRSYICNICGYAYYCQTALGRHYRKAHNTCAI
uniref:ZF(C2H2)-13 zinc finger protein n=1 Tax=Phallusia mammillata TaxID=59560 RepID=A0A6F9DY97_9ASCI|nr:ZF(C2H2)-13 zinc finger protein [Phallusia mammillata]